MRGVILSGGWILVAALIRWRAPGPVGEFAWGSVLLPMTWVGFRWNWRWSAWLVVMANALAVSFWGCGWVTFSMVAMSMAMIPLPAALFVSTGGSRRRQAHWEVQQRVALESRRAVEQRQRTLAEEHGQLEQTLGQLSGLYELTKRLLATGDRLEAVRHLTDALTSVFPQVAFKLCFVRQTESASELEGGWRLGASGIQPTDVTDADRWLLTQLTRQPAIWSSDPMVRVVATASFEIPEDLRTATAFPLVVDHTLQGFLLVDHLSGEAVERCGILVSQFALAVRRIRLYERVQELAIRDGLTGLFVRRHFLSRLQEEVARAARHELPLTFLMVDLDHFKAINDAHGHLVGDTVLRELAAILRTQVREVDLLGRYGGEEFGIALLETGADQGQVAAERIRQVVAQTVFRAYDERLSITVSVGLATFPKDASSAGELVERADCAMYRAKQSGRNHVSVYGVS